MNTDRKQADEVGYGHCEQANSDSIAKNGGFSKLALHMYFYAEKLYWTFQNFHVDSVKGISIFRHPV